jgi:hypothetical protein
MQVFAVVNTEMLQNPKVLSFDQPHRSAHSDGSHGSHCIH